MYCKSQDALNEEAEMAELGIKCGQDVDILSSDEAAKLNPGFDIDTMGAVHFKNDAWFTPSVFMEKFKHYMEETGVNFQLNTRVIGVENTNGKINKTHYSKRRYSSRSICNSNRLLDS